MCFEGTRVVFWPLSCYKELKLTTNRFTGHTLHRLLIQMQNISLRSSGMRRKQNFKQSWLLLFAFSPPLFFRFSCLIFFFSCWAFSRLHYGGNSFRKALRILGLGERKGRWVMRFSCRFSGQCYMVFRLFLRCPWLNCAHSGMVWKISSLCTS